MEYKKITHEIIIDGNGNIDAHIVPVDETDSYEEALIWHVNGCEVVNSNNELIEIDMDKVDWDEMYERLAAGECTDIATLCEYMCVTYDELIENMKEYGYEGGI